MKKSLYYIALLAVLLPACKMSQDGRSENKPNIILMVADDMGWADPGCYGGAAETPHLDQLAKNGIRFTDMYAAASNCSPSRAGLLTGKSPAMVGMYNYRPPDHPMHLRDEEVTIAEVLQGHGYSTSHFGKWHLGCLPQDSTLNHPQPGDQGFEYSFGTENNAQPSHLNPINFVEDGMRLPQQMGYSCQILADHVISWLDKRVEPEKPFFSYVAFHEPHAKIASPPELVEKYSVFPSADAEYLANIENLDSAAGRIIHYLVENSLIDNTIIIFVSDNGSYRQQSNGPLRAVKSYVYEGGIRVPGIIHLPIMDRQGAVIEEAVGFVDMMPTLCDLLQIEPPDHSNLDGTSILGLLKGQEFHRVKPLYWFFYRTSPEMALRMDDVMILGKDNDTIPRTHRFSRPDMDYIKHMSLVEYELYDLNTDKGQHENIMDLHPKSKDYKAVINEKLIEIQEKGYYWSTLPEPQGPRRIKTDWVPYERH
jgi:arylsulfatase A